MAKILLVEDDLDLANNVCDVLKADKHRVEHVGDGADALHMLSVYEYDLIVLDWAMPKISGLDVCRQFRAMRGHTPILMLTGKNDISEKESGLDAGADDYLTKPFDKRELSARVRALLRRPRTLPGTLIEIDDIRLHREERKVFKSGCEIDLPPIQFNLLEYLMLHPNQIFSSDTLLGRLWSSETDVAPDAVRKTVNKLRAKIDSEGKKSLIRTIHGVGYGIETSD